MHVSAPVFEQQANAQTHLECDSADDKAALCDPGFGFRGAASSRGPDADRDGFARELDRRASICECVGAGCADGRPANLLFGESASQWARPEETDCWCWASLRKSLSVSDV